MKGRHTVMTANDVYQVSTGHVRSIDPMPIFNRVWMNDAIWSPKNTRHYEYIPVARITYRVIPSFEVTRPADDVAALSQVSTSLSHSTTAINKGKKKSKRITMEQHQEATIKTHVPHNIFFSCLMP